MVSVQLILLALLVFTAAGTARGNPLPASPALIISTVAATHVALLLLVAVRARRVARLLHQPTAAAAVLADRLDRFLDHARWLTVALAALQFWGLGWNNLVLKPVGWNLGRWPMVGETVLLAAPLLTWLGFWIAHYQVVAAIHDRSLPYRLAMGLPAHEMPKLGAYVFMQIRHNYFLLLPMFLATLVESLLSSRGGWLAEISAPVSVAVLLLAAPTLLTFIWRTSSLRGPLRDRLNAVAARHGVRFRNVLIWHTHHHVRNAAVLGHLPFARYFLMSDALLETLTDRQIEAVFAHEVGHARHRHLWWYGAALIGAVGVAWWGGLQIVWIYEHLRGRPLLADDQDMLAAIAQMVFIGGFVAVIFSRLSKRFEHQADWFAAQHMAESLVREPEIQADAAALAAYMGAPLPPPSPPTPPPPQPGSTLVDAPGTPGSEPSAARCASAGSILPWPHVPADPAALRQGAGMFIGTLATIVELSNRSPDRGGWLHPSVRQREALLDELAAYPRARALFDRTMRRTRVFIVALLLVGIVLTSLHWKDIFLSADAAPSPAAGTPTTESDGGP
jgi:Zn-dependent protease with chaperone function